MTRAMAAAILVMTLVLGGCAQILRGGYNSPGVRVHVANESWDAVDVTVHGRDGVQQLGRVWRDEYRIFDLAEVPVGVRRSYVIRATAPSEESFETDTIVARRGMLIDLRLESPLRRSRWSGY